MEERLSQEDFEKINDSYALHELEIQRISSSLPHSFYELNKDLIINSLMLAFALPALKFSFPNHPKYVAAFSCLAVLGFGYDLIKNLRETYYPFKKLEHLRHQSGELFEIIVEEMKNREKSIESELN